LSPDRSGDAISIERRSQPATSYPRIAEILHIPRPALQSARKTAGPGDPLVAVALVRVGTCRTTDAIVRSTPA